MMLRVSLIVAVIGLVIGVVSASLVGVSIYFTTTAGVEAEQPAAVTTIRRLKPLAETNPTTDPTRASTPTVQILPLFGEGGSGDNVTPTPAASASSDGDVLPAPTATTTVTQTKAISEQITLVESTAEPTVEPALEPTEETPYTDPYTSSNQVAPPPTAAPTAEPTEEAPAFSAAGCPLNSSAHFDLIPIEGAPHHDHPADVHGDLNLALRGYVPIGGEHSLITYQGDTDSQAPQLAGLFEPNRVPQISNLYRVNDWIWDSGQCGGHPRGCPGPPGDTFWDATLAGFTTTPGEHIHVPERGPQIYGGGFVAMVLYAEETRITLGYTRKDTVAAGYTVHVEGVCVDPNLIGLYNAQRDAEGWIATGHLPALRNNQSFGTALSAEIRVAVRDAGSFMDPRSKKDWWVGQ